MHDPRTPAEALAAAAKQSREGPRFGLNECKKQTRLLYGVPSDGTPSAAAAWKAAEHTHPGPLTLSEVPRGALVWWTGGKDGFGHVALYAGAGLVWSTDIGRPGMFDLVPVSRISQAWGLTLVGWSEDIDGVRVIHPALGRIGQARKLLAAAAHDDSLTAARRARARAALAALRDEVTP